MPATTPMDEREIVGCLGRWYDGADVRRAAAQIMAEAMQLFGSDSAAWALLAQRSQYDGMRRLQLMVGNVVRTSLREDGATVLYFLPGDREVAKRAAAGRAGTSLEEGPYKWPCLVVPERWLIEVLRDAGDAHRRHLREHAPGPRAKPTIRASSHAPAAVDELERILGRSVARPAYAR